MLVAMLAGFSISSLAQDHGSITFNGKTIQLTGYRTRLSNDKRWIIAEGKNDGKLYSVTVTLKPDVSREGTIKTDATHSVTLTISNADYSNAENHCFDGGSNITVVPKSGKFTVSGKDLKSGNCFGRTANNEKLSIVVKP